MTRQEDHQKPSTPPPPVPASGPTWPKWPKAALAATAAVVGVVVGLITGIALGASFGSDTTGAAPEACIEAIDIADEIIGINSEAFSATADAVEAITNNNYVAASRHMDDVDTATAQLRDIREDYHAAKDGCRGA